MPLILNASLSISYNQGFVMPIRYAKCAFYGLRIGTETTCEADPKPSNPQLTRQLNLLLPPIIPSATHTTQPAPSNPQPSPTHNLPQHQQSPKPLNPSPPQKTTTQTSPQQQLFRKPIIPLYQPRSPSPILIHHSHFYHPSP